MLRVAGPAALLRDVVKREARAAACARALHASGARQTNALLFALVALALVLAPAAVAAQQCGNWQGDTQNYTCVTSVPCGVPPTTSTCAVLVAPVLGTFTPCECTSCVYNDATQQCQGACPYTFECAVDAAVPRTCHCLKAPPPSPSPTPAPVPTPPTPAPAPTPAPPCGTYVPPVVYTGTMNDYLCDKPQCPTDPARLCGITQPINASSPTMPPCVCTTCRYAVNGPGGATCTGTCPLGGACALVAGTDTCVCQDAPNPPPPPPPACVWKGGNPTVPGGALECEPAKCPLDPTQRCVLMAPEGALTAAVPASCGCTTCRVDATGQRCAGKCEIGAECARVPGTGTAPTDGTPPVPLMCSCSPVPAPAPVPCSEFGGDEKTWLCRESECAPVQIPGTTILQPRQCGVLEKPVAGVAPFYSCTTCIFNPQLQRCQGKCQLGHVCTRGQNDEICRCVRELAPHWWVLLSLAAAVAIGFALWALMDNQRQVPPASPAARASWDLAKNKGL